MNGVLAIFFGTILSGIIAILGNSLGRFIGRKKLSIFHLRPRYTSNVITIATGGLIFLVTVLVLQAISKPVHAMLFELESLQDNLAVTRTDLATTLDQLKQVKVQLNDLVRKNNEVIRKESPIFDHDDIIFTGVVDCDASRQGVKEQVDALLAEANSSVISMVNAIARQKNDKLVPETSKVVGYAGQDTKEQVIEKLATLSGNWLVTLRSTWNVYYPEPVVPVYIESRPFFRVFKKGDLIAKTTFKEHRDSKQVLDGIENFLHVGVRRIVDGEFPVPNSDKQTSILPPPHQKQVPLEFPLETIVDIRDDIIRSKGPVTLKFVANQDIYNVAPLNARLEVAP